MSVGTTPLSAECGPPLRAGYEDARTGGPPPRIRTRIEKSPNRR